MTLADVMTTRFGRDWRRADPLGSAQVAVFEDRCGIRLPEPYKSFVATTANGAVGPPTYGLLPLDESVGATLKPERLRRAFPLTERWIWEGKVELDDPRVAEVRAAGSLPLGTDGDGMDYVLIVSGAAAGQVWLITDVGAIPIAEDFGKWLKGDVSADAEWTIR